MSRKPTFCMQLREVRGQSAGLNEHVRPLHWCASLLRKQAGAGRRFRRPGAPISKPSKQSRREQLQISACRWEGSFTGRLPGNASLWNRAEFLWNARMLPRNRGALSHPATETTLSLCQELPVFRSGKETGKDTPEAKAPVCYVLDVHQTPR